MPPKIPQRKFSITDEEYEAKREEAATQGLSFSNFVRKKLKLKPLHHGAEKQNKRNPFGRAGKKEEA